LNCRRINGSTGIVKYCTASAASAASVVSTRVGRINTGIFGSGAVYRDATPEEAKIFDEIMNGVCFVPYPTK
jgi:hypothetical protein